MPSARQWRNAAAGLRDHAARWEQMAAEHEGVEIEVFAALTEWVTATGLLDHEKAAIRLRAAYARWQDGEHRATYDELAAADTGKTDPERTPE